MSSAPQTDEAAEPPVPEVASSTPAAWRWPTGRPPAAQTDVEDDDDDAGTPPKTDFWRRPVARDLGAGAAFVLFAVWLARGLLAAPHTRVLTYNPNDQALIEWFLAQGTRLYTGDFHLLSHLMNVPDGVNMMANASHLLLAFMMAPVTLAFGAPVSFAIVVAGNLAATGIGWYLLFARTLGLHRLAAGIGGALCAFGPGIISQSNAHTHITAQWLVPAIVWTVLRLARPPLTGVVILRTGALLGVLVFLHVLLGEEVLFFTAMSLTIFCVLYAVFAPRTAARVAPGLLAGLAVAVTVGIATLTPFLRMQFGGPQSVPNGPFNPAFFSADVYSFFAISPLSLAGQQAAGQLSQGPAENNTFFGVPLILVVLGSTIWLWRRPVVIAGTLTGIVMCLFALGPQIVIDRVRTEHKGPYAMLEGVPVVDGALPTRFALAAIPLFAIVLALAVHTALTSSETLKILVPVTAIAALVPIAPLPLAVQDRPPVPQFISEGYWRSCVPDGGVLVPVPLPAPDYPEPLRWAAAANTEFAVPEGVFIAPYAAEGRASFGIYPRGTSRLFKQVAENGLVAEVGEPERAQAVTDVAYWNASCFVLAAHPNEAALKSTVDQLFGPGRRVADAWTWQVTP